MCSSPLTLILECLSPPSTHRPRWGSCSTSPPSGAWRWCDCTVSSSDCTTRRSPCRWKPPETQGGPQAAVSEVVQGRDPSHKDDYIVKYLLTPEQQEFGNKFVMDAFRHHMDADRKSSEQFYEGWYQYVAQIASGVTARDLTQEETMYLSDEQKEQLNQIRDAFLKAREGQEPNYMV
ncbi:hypothetical protein AGDE_08392 [Angomonas deanei]|nr:hypothetical protein AGDE_08392 [Angomonas deanei]|eukprot:EPY33020.1 hypothetical protein AGDE_08392 [Angomonas deanei]